MGDRRLTNVYSVEEYTLKQEKTDQKTERDLRFRNLFLKTYDEDMIIEDFSAVELKAEFSQFIISVRTNDGTEYKPTSHRSFIASFERHL